jgi:hypothetical protein
MAKGPQGTDYVRELHSLERQHVVLDLLHVSPGLAFWEREERSRTLDGLVDMAIGSEKRRIASIANFDTPYRAAGTCFFDAGIEAMCLGLVRRFATGRPIVEYLEASEDASERKLTLVGATA